MNQSYRTEDIPSKNNRKTGQNVLIAVLAVCALPVLVPVVLFLGAGGLGLIVALGAGGIGIVLTVGAGLAGLAVTAATCVLGLLVCLAALAAVGVIGTGAGIALLFQTPASGLAVLGASLLMLGGGLLGGLLTWGLVVLMVSLIRRIAAYGQGAGKRRSSGAAKEGQKDEA